MIHQQFIGLNSVDVGSWKADNEEIDNKYCE